MNRWAMAFLVLTLLAGALGFGNNGVAGSYAGDAGKILFFIFFCMFLLSFFFCTIGKLNGGGDEHAS